MDRDFPKICEKYERLLEDDMGGGMPPPDGGGGDGGGGGGGQEAPEPCFTDSAGIRFLAPFIRLYNKAKEAGSLPDYLTKDMIRDRAYLREMLSERIKNRLNRIFRLAGIPQSYIDNMVEKNKKAYAKVAENKGGKPEIRPVGDSVLRSMLDVLGILGSRLRDDEMHSVGGGMSPATEVGFPNKDEIDCANIWVAYNRIVADVKGEYRSGV